MKNLIFESPDQIRAFAKASKLSIPAHSAHLVEQSETEFLHWLRKGNPIQQKAAQKLAAARWKIQQSRKFHQSKLDKLGSPKAPLKGRGNSRMSFFGSAGLRIPNSHLDKCTYFQKSPTTGRRHFSTTFVISPEAGTIINSFKNESAKIQNGLVYGGKSVSTEKKVEA